MSLKRGDLVLVHTSGSLICWLIRKITGSYWNHVAWSIGHCSLIESNGGRGVYVSSESAYDLNNPFKTKVVRIINGIITEEQLTNALLEAQSQNKKKYDWWLIIKLFWLYLTGSRKKKSSGDWDNEWICSELIARPLWKHAKFKFRDDIPVENIVPGDIEKSKKVVMCNPSTV